MKPVSMFKPVSIGSNQTRDLPSPCHDQYDEAAWTKAAKNLGDIFRKSRQELPPSCHDDYDEAAWTAALKKSKKKGQRIIISPFKS